MNDSVDVTWPDPEPWERPEATILERILTQHWDMAACPCWVCEESRAIGYRPRSQYLGAARWERGTVRVEALAPSVRGERT